MIIGFGIYGYITILTSILMLSLYVGLVLYIVMDEYIKKRRY